MAALELFSFAWFICFMIYLVVKMKRVQRQRTNLFYSMNNRPCLKYVKTRLQVRKVFNEDFLGIKWLAKKLYFSEESIRDAPFLAKPKFTPLDLPNGGIRSAIAAIIGENIGTTTEDKFMEKMNGLYESLMEDEDGTDLIHSAIRFEMKNNCIKNPYDMFGSKLCKLIETAFQDIVDMKKSARYVQPVYTRFCDSYISRWFTCKIDYLLTTATKIVEEHKKVCLSLGAFSVIIGIILAIVFLCHKKLYLEMGILLSLLVVNFVIIALTKDYPLYAKFKLSSFIACVSKVIFLTVGLYVYDYASDIQVFLHYMFAFVNADELSKLSDKFDGIPEYSIIGHMKECVGVEHSRNISEIHAPIVFLLTLLLLTAMLTLPSLN